MPRFKKVKLDEIISAQQIPAPKPKEEPVNAPVFDERADRLEIVLAEFTQAIKSLKGLPEVLRFLKVIAEREYPKFPEIPEIRFPDVQRVLVENQEKTDYTSVETLLKQILGAVSQREAPQTIVVQAPTTGSTEVVEDTARAAPVGVRTRAKSRLVPEIPTGAVDGSNKTYFLSRAPRYNTQVFLFRNSAYQTPGGVDYTITGNKIVYNTPMLSDRGDGTPEAHYVLIFQS